MARDMSVQNPTAGQMDLFGVSVEHSVAPVAGLVGEPAAPITEPVSSKNDAISISSISTTAQVGVASGIQDAGEELTYNRRNRIKAAKGWNDVAHLNDALKVKEVVKANIWPKPDYKQLIEDGMKPLVAHIVKQVYDSVAAKPAIGYRETLDDVVLQRYIESLNRIEKGLMQWASDQEALKQWAAANAKVVGAMLGQRTSLSELVNEPTTLMDAVFPGGWKNYRAEMSIAGGNKLLGALRPQYDEIRRAIKAVENGWPEKREAWEIQGYRIVENPKIEANESRIHAGVFNLKVDELFVGSFDSSEMAQGVASVIKPFVLFNKRVMIDSYASEEEAVNAAKERTRRDKGNVIGDKGVKVEAVEREGVARRMEGEDISSERLMSEFGLRGVNFGNWMKTPSARVEAQLHLNHAFDSLHDLADILGVTPRAMSLNGMLGLAIGAQGGGGSAAAHFVAGVNEINLTRTSGAGSLAHEWAHAMDHYFAAQAGLSSSPEPFLTEHASLKPTKTTTEMVDGKWVSSEVPRFGNLRTEVVAAFSSIVDSMNKRLQTDDEAIAARQNALVKSQNAVNNWLNDIRRDFSGQEEAFDVLAARIREGDVGDGKLAISRNTYISPVIADMRDLYKAQHGRVYSIDNIKSLQAWVDRVAYQKSEMSAEASHVPQKVSTEFAENAKLLDKEKGGKPYWSTTLEKFARAFDAFVSDELEARQAKNGYLSHTRREENTIPMGDERKAINAAFKTLVNEINTRETEKGVALCSMGVFVEHHGMPVSEIHAEINRLRQQWPSMPNVSVVDSVAELPCDVPDNADGVYYDGHVFVVADNITDLQQLQKVMAHECVLHHSLETMLGDYGFSKLHTGIQALKKAGDPVVGELAANILSRYGKLPPEVETREIIARAGEQCLDKTGNIKIGFGFMKSVFAGVANWLRDMGFKIPFTNIELQGIIYDSGKWIQRDREVEYQSSQWNRNKVALNSFAGIRAENAPLDKLKLAHEMVLAGNDDRKIWNKTGWTFGFADGKPRFEVADDMAQVDLDMVLDGNESTLGNILSHEKLFSEYPLLSQISSVIKHTADEKERGHYVESRMNGSVVRELSVVAKDVMSPTLHEVQHAIQMLEGFAIGGRAGRFEEQDITDKELAKLNSLIHDLYSKNPEFYQDVVKATQLQIAVKDKYGSTLGDENDPLVQEWWKAIDKRDAHVESKSWFSLKSTENLIAKNRVIQTSEDQYRRLAGEVEARLTQSRLNMSSDERASTYPIDGMDVPVQDQVVNFSAWPKAVETGNYSGKILNVTNGLVEQKIGREGQTVFHTLSRLSANVGIGDIVDIGYRDGVGVVAGCEIEVERGR